MVIVIVCVLYVYYVYSTCGVCVCVYDIYGMCCVRMYVCVCGVVRGQLLIFSYHTVLGTELSSIRLDDWWPLLLNHLNGLPTFLEKGPPLPDRGSVGPQGL